MSSQSTLSVRERTEAWLIEEGYSVSDGNRPNCVFSLLAKASSGLNVMVMQGNNRKDSILIGSLVLTQPNREQFNHLSPQQQQEFLWGLRYALSSFPISWEFFPQTAAMDALPEEIVVSETLYFDALTKSNFMRDIQRVLSATIVVLLKIQQRFGTQLASTQPSYAQ